MVESPTGHLRTLHQLSIISKMMRFACVDL